MAVLGKPFVVGQMALYEHPRRWVCLRALAGLVDKLYVRYDCRKGGAVGAAEVIANLETMGKLGGVLSTTDPWDGWNWREQMLRMLDTVRPDIVLTLDEDEAFGNGIREDINRLASIGRGQMAFAYEAPMPTSDGFDTGPKPYPSKPHVKAFCWRPNLSYLPYKRRARLTNYDKDNYVLGRSKILHYCWFTAEMRKSHQTTAKTKMEVHNGNTV